MPFNVLHHDNGIINNQTDRQDDGQQGQEIDGEAEDLHQEDGADQGERNGHHRDENRAERAEEQEDDDHNDEEGVTEGLENFPNRRIDVIGGVIGDPRLHADRQILLDRRHLLAHQLDDIQ